MKKNRMAFACLAMALSLGASIFTPLCAFAEVDDMMLDSCDEIDNCAIVKNAEELRNFFVVDESESYLTREGESTLIIGADFDMTLDYYIKGVDLSIYLGDYTITMNDFSFLFYESKVRIYGSESGALDNAAGYYSPLYIRENSDVTMNGGVIRSGEENEGDNGVLVDDGAKFTLNDGKIYAKTWVVTVFDNSEFVMNGGELNTTGPNSIGIAGNGTADPNSANYGGNAKLTLNAGTINSNDLGVYAPQVDGVTTLGKDLTINAKKCGVEIRAGELNVDGATINVDADAEYVFNPNGSGSTASGVAIAVAQHTTTMPISANVNDGKFTAPVAFAESNPQKNEEEDVAKVSLLITGGEFDATNGEPVVASEDVVKFIQGGTFNKEVETEYIAEGYDLYDLSQDGPWIVDEATTVILPERVFLQVGETYEVELSDIAKKYGTFGLSEKIATVDENIITATEVGTSVVNFQLHNYNEPLDENFELIVYSVMPADEDALDDEEEKDEVAQYATEQIAELIETGESSNENIILYDESDKNGVEVLKERLVSGDEIITEVVSESYDDEEMYGQADTYEEIKEVLGDDQILKMFDVRVLIKTSNGATLGQIVNLNTPKTISVELNEEDLTAPEGYSRNYYVIRGHQTINGGKAAEKIEATLEGNILSFESDKFSTFAVAYVDTETPVDPTDEPVEPVVDPTDEPVEPTDEPVEAEAPNTGTVTTAGASAISAAFMTAIMTGVITMIMAFMVMMKKRQ